MQEFTYKCVPVPSSITVEKARQNQAQAIFEYQNMINEAAAGGWELSHVDSITSEQPAGFLGGLFGQPPMITAHKLLVFKKAIMEASS